MCRYCGSRALAAGSGERNAKPKRTAGLRRQLVRKQLRAGHTCERDRGVAGAAPGARTPCDLTGTPSSSMGRRCARTGQALARARCTRRGYDMSRLASVTHLSVYDWGAADRGTEVGVG